MANADTTSGILRSAGFEQIALQRCDLPLRIGGVPLFSGFMYAAIGSFMARITRLFDIGFERYPPVWAPWLLAILAYANFFSHHYIVDFRYALFALSGVLFWRTTLVFTPDGTPRRMPLLMGTVLVSLFIWLAENMGTFAGAWIYPTQRHGWVPAPLAKLGSWYLLMLLSFVLVTIVHRPKVAAVIPPPTPSPPAPWPAGRRSA